VAAFMTIGAVNDGHVMVVPAQHASSLEELDPEIGGEMFKLAMRLGAALRRSDLRCEGVNLLLNDGRVAFQSVYHCHLHVIPRFWRDGFRLIMPPDFEYSRDRAQLDKAAASLRAALEIEDDHHPPS
jgi:histidine triad (HIT) family protein